MRNAKLKFLLWLNVKIDTMISDMIHGKCEACGEVACMDHCLECSFELPFHQDDCPMKFGLSTVREEDVYVYKMTCGMCGQKFSLNDPVLVEEVDEDVMCVCLDCAIGRKLP